MDSFPPAECRQLFRGREKSQNQGCKSKADAVIGRAQKSNGWDWTLLHGIAMNFTLFSSGVKAVNPRCRRQTHV